LSYTSTLAYYAHDRLEFNQVNAYLLSFVTYLHILD